MIDQFINFVIRPPRAEYIPDQYLWEPEFTLAGRKYKRQDLELTNRRGHTLQCSHYVPAVVPDNIALPCVIYCHGNSGCRADANEAAVILLPSNITVFALDFSGSGLSDGDYVSLGWHEKDDLKAVVSYLRSSKLVSSIGLWGRSMGAVTCLLYGAEDPSIGGMVMDSAFSNLFDLIMELVDVYKIRLPRFTVKMAVQYMRRVIQKKAQFDIMDLNVLQFAPKSFIPALFGHGSEDTFVQPRHSDLIYKSYVGDKNIIKFEGDHNSPRPQFYYDTVSIFFYNALHPPPISLIPSNKAEKYYDLGNLGVGGGTDETLLHEIINGLRSVGNHSAGSSSTPAGIPLRAGSTAKSVVDLLSESVSSLSVKNKVNFLSDEVNPKTEGGENVFEDSPSQDKCDTQNEEWCSHTSSNRESWGGCSSLGAGSEESSAADGPGFSINKEQESSTDLVQDSVAHQTAKKHKHNYSTFRALATPLRRIQGRSKVKDKNKGMVPPKNPKEGLKLEKGDTLSQRLRVCFLGRRPYHKRHQSV